MKTLSEIQAALAGASPVPFVLLNATGGAYVPIYLAAGDQVGRYASVNAGNSSVFFVGGGGLNAAFAKTVAQPGSYQNLQTALYNSATSTYSWQHYAPPAPVQFAMVRRPGGGGTFFDYEGTIFIDVFQPGTTPAGNPDNYAMIYVCPPAGFNYAGPAQFLANVEATAVNLVDAIRHYNEQLVPTVSGLGVIEVVRVFLFSSGIFRQANTTVAEVAQAVCSGLLDGLAAGPTGLQLIQLPNSSGEYSTVAPTGGAA